MGHQFDFAVKVSLFSLYTLIYYHNIIDFFFLIGLESLNRDHHARFKNATNHDTHRKAANGQSVYVRPQSSIEQLMNHQLCESILQNRFLLRESRDKLIKCNGVLTNFDGCGWPRSRRGVQFSPQELQFLQVTPAGIIIPTLY